MSVRHLELRAAFAVVCLVLFSSFCAAQESKPFRVDSYVPERFEDLWVVGDFHTNYYGNSRSYRSVDHNSWGDFGYATGNVNLNVNGGYRRQTISRDWLIQLETNLSIGHSGNHSGDSAIGDFGRLEYSKNDFSEWFGALRAKLGTDLLQYAFGTKFLFLTMDQSVQFNQEFDGNGLGESYSTWLSNDGTATELYTSTRRSEYSRRRWFDGEISGGFGLGRLNEGRYAAIAMELIKELRERGLLHHHPSTGQLTRLTEQIYDYFNMHTPDSRLTRIEYLSAMMEYLASEHVLDSVGMPAPYVVEDVVLYYPRYARSFGTRLRVGAGVEWHYDRQLNVGENFQEQRLIEYNVNDPDVRSTSNTRWKSRSVNVFESDRIAPYLMVLCELGEPINERWQINSALLGKFYFAKSSDIQDHSVEYSDNYQLTANVSLIHIFSTRTTGLLLFSASYESFRELRDLEDPYYDYATALWVGRQHMTGLTADVRINYRIAIPTQLTLNGTYELSDKRIMDYNGDTSDSRFQVGASISHWIL